MNEMRDRPLIAGEMLSVCCTRGIPSFRLRFVLNK